MTRNGDAGTVTTTESGAPWTTARLRGEGVRLRIVYVLISSAWHSVAACVFRQVTDERVFSLCSNMLGHGSLRDPLDVKQLALQIRNSDYSQRVRVSTVFHTATMWICRQ